MFKRANSNNFFYGLTRAFLPSSCRERDRSAVVGFAQDLRGGQFDLKVALISADQNTAIGTALAEPEPGPYGALSLSLSHALESMHGGWHHEFQGWAASLRGNSIHAAAETQMFKGTQRGSGNPCRVPPITAAVH